MESINNIVCPVCTLYLRPGITLQSHLASHPKQKVIEALIKASQGTPGLDKIENNLPSAPSDRSSYQQPQINAPVQQPWHQPVTLPPVAPNQVPTNHSFIYQQFMSSSTGTQPILNVNPMAQHFVAVPTVINPQMFCSPYVFHHAQQQQLQIVTTNPNVVPRQPIGLLNNEVTITPTIPNNIISSPSITTKQVDSSTSTEPYIPCEHKAEIQQNQENVLHEPTTENNDEALEVYPDMYADMGANEELEVTPIAEVFLKTDKSDTDINNMEQTDELNNVDKVDISKVEEEVIVERILGVGDMSSTRSDQSEESQWQNEPECQSVTEESECQNEIDESELLIETEKSEWQNNSPESDWQDTKVKKSSQSDWRNESSMSQTKSCIKNESLTQNNEENKFKYTSIELQGDQIYKLSFPTDSLQIDQVFSLSEQNTSEPSSSAVVMNENVTLLELDDMNFMIANELMSTDKTIISKVEDYECVKDATGSKILMKIEEVCATSQVDQKENIMKFDDKIIEEESISSLNIHADEHMPPRGELSEPESNGASDWGKIYNEQECSSGMSTSYDLLARESWEGSDGSDTEMPPLQSRNPSGFILPDKEDTPSKKPALINYNCTTCGKAFSCPKERRVHQSKEHRSNIDSDLTKKIKVRPARKPKPPTINIKQENNFEIFAKSEPVENVQEKEDVKLNIEPITMPDVKDIKQEILCPMCGEMFSSSKDYNRHMIKTHKVNSDRYKCKTCLESFPSEIKFTEHLRIHPLECNQCGKNFYRKYNLHMHMKRHYNIRPHKCEACGKAFLTKQKLQEHTNVHTGNAPIKCTMCEETFRRHSNLVQHRNKHHFNIKKKYKDFVCHCGEVFHSKNKLSWHKEIHDSKPKACTYCHEKFVHVSSLTRHIRRSHNQNYVPLGKKDAENVECHVCKGVYFKSSIEAHMQIHSGQRQFSCVICGKEFTTKWNLKLHKWTHTSRTSKPFKCEQCNGAFIRLTDFQAHMNSHKSVRPYTCNYCGCKFIRKYNCQRHVREHEENKSHNCTVCSKSFHRSYYLKEHMRVHTGARPFACHICGKTSTTKSNHNKHMKIHHAREPVSTEG